MSIRLTGMNSGLDTDAMVKDLVNAYDKKKETMKGDQKRLTWKQEAWSDLNTKIKNFVTKSLSNMRFSTAYTKKSTAISDTSIASVVSSDGAINGTQTLKVTGLAQSGYLTGSELKTTDDKAVKSGTKLSELGFGEETKQITLSKGGKDPITIDLNGNMTVGQFVNTVKSAGLNANFDEANGRLYISALDTGTANDFSFGIPEGGDATSLEKLGLTGGDSFKQDAANASIVLNGVTYTSNSNTFSINGLTITAKEKTQGDSFVSLTTSTDYDAVYDSIKNFIKEYSNLVNEMDKLYNAESAEKYKMLTSEEKEAMSEDEVEEWEKKIKSALLRKDDTLSSLTATMRGAMLETYKVDGKTYSLSSFGINTLSYFLAADNEKNAYHIDGDPDDPDTAGEPDKLKAAIASNPEAVMGFFQNLASNMYNKMSKMSATNQYRSFGNFYEDKKLKKEQDEWDSKIKKYEDYVAKVEDRYYKQFTQMEKVMGQMQSQQSYISQLMGG
ncbi:MAG: flagellar filament capping protein FliD [Lachnospiraceae bacterium]|nr:flagellar filament capping protein FliD [Lachnospiraceae bacterium]